jgi:hypothetical protein
LFVPAATPESATGTDPTTALAAVGKTSEIPTPATTSGATTGP